MLFNSFDFLVFFPIVTVLYFLLPYRFRWFHLLVASCIFYIAFIPLYIVILLFTIVVDYFAGILIENASHTRRKNFLLLSLAANIGILAVFKYYNFFNHNLMDVASWLGFSYALPFLSVALPVGLSFHTFQAMSYTIEVYRGKQKAERHFGIYALYVMFYPQLVAGPIERPQNMLHQFRERHQFDYGQVVDGLFLMLWGMFKKIVIADRLAVYVDIVYGSPHSWNGITLILATVFFAFQIYCDFSGYSDIAIGAAQIMGFKLMINFDRPYQSGSISEFWNRWHISLSTWLRDYIFFPIRRALLKRPKPFPNWLNQAIPPLATMLVSGIWHGANWTFVVWGVIHGFYLLCSTWTEGIRDKFLQRFGLLHYPKLLHALSIVSTFVLTCYAWIFFRSDSIPTAIYINQSIALGVLKLPSMIRSLPNVAEILGPISVYGFIVNIAIITFMEFVHAMQNGRTMRALLVEKPVWFRWTVYYGLVAAILILGEFSKRQFIYFQF